MKNNKLLLILVIIFLILCVVVSFLAYSVYLKTKTNPTDNITTTLNEASKQADKNNSLLDIDPDNLTESSITNVLNTALNNPNSQTIPTQDTINSNTSNTINTNADPNAITTVTPSGATNSTQSNSDISTLVQNTLVDGNQVLIVPLERVSNPPFDEIIANNPKILDPNSTNSDTRLFLYNPNTKKIEYLDSQIFYLADFTYKNNTYWVSLAYRSLKISKPNFKDSITVNYAGTGLITKLEQDKQNPTLFKATAVTGLSDFKTYTLDLSKAIDDATANVVVNN